MICEISTKICFVRNRRKGLEILTLRKKLK